MVAVFVHEFDVALVAHRAAGLDRRLPAGDRLVEREQDIERLRQVARLQKSQLEHLIAMLARKCAELEKLIGNGGELQIALKLLEEAQQEAPVAATVGQMWCVTAPGIVYHRICDDKSARTFKDLLGDYQGWVVADALGTHQAGARECRGLKLEACWAHVLRRFRDAVADFPDAQLMLAWIQDLYAIDARATDLTGVRRAPRPTELARTPDAAVNRPPRNTVAPPKT